MLNVLTIEEKILIQKAWKFHSDLIYQDEEAAGDFCLKSGFYEFAHCEISEAQLADRLKALVFAGWSAT